MHLVPKSQRGIRKSEAENKRVSGANEFVLTNPHHATERGSMPDRERFDTNIDKTLLVNGFEYYDDWEYGPMSGWQTDWERYTLKLMGHDFGYWLIIGCHASGASPTMNIGSSNSAEDIIAIRDALKKLW